MNSSALESRDLGLEITTLPNTNPNPNANSNPKPNPNPTPNPYPNLP